MWDVSLRVVPRWSRLASVNGGVYLDFRFATATSHERPKIARLIGGIHATKDTTEPN